MLIIISDGASLIYTSPSVSGPLQSLIHSSLGIQSLLKKQPLKPNVIDRDKVLVPPNWDSWGKIRVLREGFDVEGVSLGWSTDIDEDVSPKSDVRRLHPDSDAAEYIQSTDTLSSALVVYEETIPNPAAETLQALTLGHVNEIDIKSMDPQAFLANQLEVLERLRHSVEPSGRGATRREAANRIATMSESGAADDNSSTDEGRISEHIGPVQFNMGGIQVDADDMLQRLKVRLLASLTASDY